jgi:hypothetical protein
MLNEEQKSKLQEPLPEWALKEHPTKSNMTVIHPMAVIDRLNDVFGIGKWQTKVEKQSSFEWTQKTRNGERQVFSATAKVMLDIPDYSIHLEQFGGSTNDDEGDALKGSATDGLTKIASYLGIGASIYKGQGNIERKDGLDTKEFAQYRDAYMNEGIAPPIEKWEEMSVVQKKIINQIKLGKRNAKNTN